MFRLTVAEKAEVITVCDHLRPLRFSPALPYAFTEHGAIMLASLLNTRIAFQASVQVVRAFVRLREILATHKCVFRPKSAACSGPCRPAVPGDAGHPFRRKPATQRSEE